MKNYNVFRYYRISIAWKTTMYFVLIEYLLHEKLQCISLLLNIYCMKNYNVFRYYRISIAWKTTMYFVIIEYLLHEKLQCISLL